jgi:hypothetical protein
MKTKSVARKEGHLKKNPSARSDRSVEPKPSTTQELSQDDIMKMLTSGKDKTLGVKQNVTLMASPVEASEILPNFHTVRHNLCFEINFR